MQSLADLYETYFQAERAWEAELRRAFGDEASAARYEARGRGSFENDLGLAYLAFHKAQNYYFSAYRAQIKAA